MGKRKSSYTKKVIPNLQLNLFFGNVLSIISLNYLLVIAQYSYKDVKNMESYVWKLDCHKRHYQEMFFSRILYAFVLMQQVHNIGQGRISYLFSGYI